MKQVRRPSPATVIALVALFVALGGTSYAVTKLPKNSVGTAQIKKNAVTSAKVKNGTLGAADLSKAARAALKGQTGPQGATGPQGPAGASTPQTIAAGAIGTSQLADGSVTNAKLAPAQAWTALPATYDADWSSNPASDPVEYVLDHEGFVHLRGQLVCTASPCNTSIWSSLPTNLRPQRNVRIPVHVTVTNGASFQLMYVELTSIGILGLKEFTAVAYPAGQLRVYVDPISWRVANP